MRDDRDAAPWDEITVSVLLHTLQTELDDIVEKIRSCAQRDIPPEQQADFRERVHALLDTFAAKATDALQGPGEDEEYTDP